MAKITESFKITINDVNAKFTCTNKAILRIFETIACSHSDMAGYGASNVEKTRLSWVLIRWKVKILERPSYGDTVKVVTWARDTGKITTHREFQMFLPNGKLSAIGSTKWALIDIDKGLTKIDNIITEQYSPEKECVFDETELKKLSSPTEFESSISYTVTRKDLDINQHVHNLNYLDFAYELIPDEVYFKEVDNIEIYYKTESKLGDNLEFRLTRENDGYTVAIVNKKTDALNTVIKLY